MNEIVIIDIVEIMIYKFSKKEKESIPGYL